LERGLSFYGNPFLFYKPTHQQKEKAGFKQKKRSTGWSSDWSFL